MNQLAGQTNLQQYQAQSLSQPHSITVNIGVTLPQSNINLQVQTDPEIPFNTFINGIKEQLFAQRMQSQYEDTIEYQLGNGSQINQSESRSLQQLGFNANCTLYVRLKLKGG